jgi:hypothetical protein
MMRGVGRQFFASCMVEYVMDEETAKAWKASKNN